jgi:hypothetical protein
LLTWRLTIIKIDEILITWRLTIIKKKAVFQLYWLLLDVK